MEHFKNYSEELGDNLKAYEYIILQLLTLILTTNVFSYLISIKYKESQTINEKVEYVSNPLNAFILLRRTREDLPKWFDYFKKKLGNGKAN